MITYELKETRFNTWYFTILENGLEMATSKPFADADSAARAMGRVQGDTEIDPLAGTANDYGKDD